jgi:hypothetical protein
VQGLPKGVINSSPICTVILRPLVSKKRSARNEACLRHLFVRIKVYRNFMCLIREFQARAACRCAAASLRRHGDSMFQMNVFTDE